jgi:hypothetical protein
MNIYDEKIPFRVEEDKSNKIETPPPQCILDMRANPKRQDLSNKQMREAEKTCIHTDYMKLKFPRERKFRVDPTVNGQQFCVISFIPSPGATPDKDKCFGVLKVRGSFATQHEAEQHAQHLLRKFDSYSDYDITYVGKDFPLMSDNACFTQETTEVNLAAQVDDLTKGYMKSKKMEEARDRESVEKRHNKLIAKTKKNEDGQIEAVEQDDEDEVLDDLEKYTQLRTKIAYAKQRMVECKQHYGEAQKALERFSGELDIADKENPAFRNQFLARYEEGLAKVGADKTKNTYIQYMKDDKDEEKKSLLEEKLE